MGFLGGLANFAQNAGPTAGAVAQAQAQGSAQRNQQAIQLLMLARQQRQMEIENALKQSQGLEAQAHAGLYQNEANPQFKGMQAGYEAQAQQPFKLQQLQAELNNRLTELKQSGANEMQIAAARIAGEKDIANAQIGAAASRQQNQQGFEQGQQQRQQQFQQNVVLPTESQNKIRGIQQTQAGEIIPSIMNAIHGTSSTPSSTPTAPLTLQQTQRAASDPDYKQFLISQGYSL